MRMMMDIWDEEEEELNIPQQFQLNVTIIEARHLSMINSDCKVVVTVGKHKKTLRSKTAKTDAPYFNEFCIFNFHQSLSKFLNEILNVKIYGIHKLLRNHLIGEFSVELSTVWHQPNHQFYHKWAALTHHKNPAAGVKGFVKCDIGILARGTKWKQLDKDLAENIENHLMVPFGEVNDRQRAKFIFSVFRADNFSDYVLKPPFNSLYAYVRITYAGKSGKTSVSRNTFEPFWNEELAFDDMIPAMCQYVHIELCDAHKTTENGTLGTANLDLRKLSHESEQGFLPTYGPSFLYIYQNFGKLDERKKCPFVSCSFTYICRLLMALRTEIVDYAEDVFVKKAKNSIKPKSITSIQEDKYFKYNEFIFFAVIFDILLFDVNIVSSKVNVRVNIGPEKPISDEHILRSSDGDKSLKTSKSSKKSKIRDSEESESSRSNKTVTFEENDKTESDSEIPLLKMEEKKIYRKGLEDQSIFKQLKNWPTKWPKKNRLGRGLNERIERREGTKFRKLKKYRKRILKNWRTDWRKKRKNDIIPEDGFQLKRIRLSTDSEIGESETQKSSSLEDISSVVEDSDSSELTKMIYQDPPKTNESNSSYELKRNEGDINLLEEDESDFSSDSIKDKKKRFYKRKFNAEYSPKRSITSEAQDIEEQNQLYKQKNKLKKRIKEFKWSSEYDSEITARTNESLIDKLKKKARSGKVLSDWPIKWRNQKRKKNEKIEIIDHEELESDMSESLIEITPKEKSSLQRDNMKSELSFDGRKKFFRKEKKGRKMIRLKNSDKKSPRNVKESDKQKGKRNKVLGRLRRDKDKSDKSQISEESGESSRALVKFTKDSTGIHTSGSEIQEITDNEELSIISDTNQSLLSEKTIWPREISSIEEDELSFDSQQHKNKKKEKSFKDKTKLKSFKDLGEEKKKLYRGSSSEGDSSTSSNLEKKNIYKNLENEDEEMDYLSSANSNKSSQISKKGILKEPSKSKEIIKQSKKNKNLRKKNKTKNLNKTEKKENLLVKESSEEIDEFEKTKLKNWYKNETDQIKISSSNEKSQENKSFDKKKEKRKINDNIYKEQNKKKIEKFRRTSTDSSKKSKMNKKIINKKKGVMKKNYDNKEWLKNNSEQIMNEQSNDEKDKILYRHVRVYNGCNSTNPHPITIRHRYGCTTFSGRYPCLHINGEWPNALRRMYRSNVVHQSVVRLTMGINDVLDYLSMENKLEASEKLKTVFREVSKLCREILLLTSKIEPEDTNLYRERKKYYHREIKGIITNMENASKKKILIAEKELNRAYDYLSTLKRYAQDPEDSFPDIEIWLIKDGKSIAQHRMHTRKIVFSPNISERGNRSGKIQPVIVRDQEGKVVAKIEMFMWFGLKNHFFECRNMLPSGYSDDVHQCPGTTITNLPLYLTYAEVHYFQCRVHLFQARITSGADENGLADPFVRVTVLDQQKESKVEKETLNPIWNETLVFPKLTIYGPADYIKINSLTITIEVIDYDYLSKNELIGRILFKPVVRLLSEKYIPPEPDWEGIRRNCSETGKILIASELLEMKKDELINMKIEKKIMRIPKEIRLRSVGYRLEVFFWGLRELRKKGIGSSKIYVTLECAGKQLNSPILKNVQNSSNFPGNIQTLLLNLPEEQKYMPPLILKIYQRETYAGNCIIPSVKIFFCETIDDDERKKKEKYLLEFIKELNKSKHDEELEALRAKKKKHNWRKKIMYMIESIFGSFHKCYQIIKCKLGKSCSIVEMDILPELQEDDTLDWWIKYYASKESELNVADVNKLVIYDEELEVQPEFHGFSDFIYTFNMVIGKVKNEIQSSILIGKVKAAVKLYRWPLESNHSSTLYGIDIRKGLLKQLPNNEAIQFVARVYIISCKNLTPKDLNGKSDPYLFLQMGNQKINDSKNYISKQVNPIFGKCYEFRGIFPNEHLLTIKVMDHDILGRNDLIGETSIDLESRYYTKHHANCGISQLYTTDGYSAWRDISKPTEILKLVCKQSNMPEPIYFEEGVRIGDYQFHADVKKEKYKKESHALAALKKWHEIPLRGFRIVPEHIETRPLYHPSFPGVEQGKIEMWIDIFPADFRYIPPIVDINPRKPVAMELRAIIWNVENVILSDTNIFNEKMSDIYVQGWLNALEHDKQMTDVHYRSMNGEGNFNWRFIFPFKYISSERRLVVYKKIPGIEIEPEELKFPCRLELQIWDNDILSDDFLGSLNLELSAMPRGAKISTRCKLSMFEESTPKINLFKIRRTRGWWPFRRVIDPESSKYSLTGKIDLELEVVTEKEAAEHPVGKGREEPRALPMPKRPESSFLWALNPLKTFRYMVIRKYGKHLILLLLVAMVIAFILIGLYAIPGYAIKRMIGA